MPLLERVCFILGLRPFSLSASGDVVYSTVGTVFSAINSALLLWKIRSYITDSHESQMSIIFSTIRCISCFTFVCIINYRIHFNSEFRLFLKEVIEICPSYESLDTFFCINAAEKFLLIAEETFYHNSKGVIEFLIAATASLFPLLVILEICVCCQSVEIACNNLFNKINEILCPECDMDGLTEVQSQNLELVQFVERVNTMCGVKMLIIITCEQLVVLYTVYRVVLEVIHGLCYPHCIVHTSIEFLNICFSLIQLWYLTQRCSSASNKANEALIMLLRAETEPMSTYVMNEVLLLAEDMSCYPIHLSACGCFSIGNSLLYAVGGIIFSLILIVAPAELSKQ